MVVEGRDGVFVILALPVLPTLPPLLPVRLSEAGRGEARRDETRRTWTGQGGARQGRTGQDVYSSTSSCPHLQEQTGGTGCILTLTCGMGRE